MTSCCLPADGATDAAPPNMLDMLDAGASGAAPPNSWIVDLFFYVNDLFLDKFVKSYREDAVPRVSNSTGV